MKNTILGIILGFTLAMIFRAGVSQATVVNQNQIIYSCSPSPSATETANLNDQL